MIVSYLITAIAYQRGAFLLKIKAINGFKDILPEEVVLWQHIEAKARDIFRRFCFQEIRLPILEKTELFARSIGEATDIVEKEMYTFTDKAITMRPEATASLLRGFIEHSLHVKQPVHRLYTLGPMFRHERPQKGRLRQFHQIDAEILGATEPGVDAELMAMGQLLLTELGLAASLEVNSLGCKECRPGFRENLVQYLNERQDGLCDDCKRRTHTNPLRVLDCKKADCKKLVQDAPSILDSLCAKCDVHFSAVQRSLDNLNVEYKLNPFMVRGLDYYTRTTFEFTTNDLGSQSAIAAGGRYDGLIEQLGGPKIPGIGFALGIERLVLLLLDKEDSEKVQQSTIDIYIAALGDEAIHFSSALIQSLRVKGISAAMNFSGRSLKSQMKQAGRLQAKHTLIIGENELANHEAVFRNMNTKQQESISIQGDFETQSSRLIDRLNDTNDYSDLYQSIKI